MPELGSLGSVRGALRNERPYRERKTTRPPESQCVFEISRPSQISSSQTAGPTETGSQRWPKAVARAMHSFVRKQQQYALTGGQGRRDLYLYHRRPGQRRMGEAQC